MDRSGKSSSIETTIGCGGSRAKHASAGSSALRQNIRIYRSSVLPYRLRHPARHEGRFAIVTRRGPGCGGRDGVGAQGSCRAGDREQRPARYDTATTASSHGLHGERTPAVEDPAGMCADGEVVWSWRPGSGVKSCGDVAANRRASEIRRATGAIVHRSPRRARRTPLKPSAQGRPGDRHTCRPTPCAFFARGTSGVSRRPAFPAPLLSEGARPKQSSGEMSREDAKVCLQVTCKSIKRSQPFKLRHCERSEAIQNLSAERFWIAPCRRVGLEMTGSPNAVAMSPMLAGQIGDRAT